MKTRSSKHTLSRVTRRREERVAKAITATGNFTLKVVAAIAGKFLVDLVLAFL